MKDRYESYIDTTTLLPVKFVGNIDEGGHKIYNNVNFHQGSGTVVTTNGVFKISNCMQDVASTMYYARNINYDKYNPGNKIPFDMFLGDKVYHLYLRFIGKETVKTQYGKLRAIKIKPLLYLSSSVQAGCY